VADIHSSPDSHSPRREWLFLWVFPLLALLLLWEVLLGGKVLLPADYLKGFAPWNSGVSGAARQLLPQWNVLQWDGMAEFFPWRLATARSFAQGHIPLWNPHILAGTPFLANSQSAPLYPLHALYYLPLGASIAVRMAWVDFLHLSLAGCFAYLLARDLRVRPLAALVAGAAFELCGFAVAWLELPSFIAVSCWIPLVLLCVARAIRTGSWRWTTGAGAAIGMMLLAGHLQIAFYGLLAAVCFWTWETGGRVFGRSGAQALGPGSPATGKRAVLSAVARGLVALVLGLGLAAPQVLSSIAFSRISHRAGAPSAPGYAGYVERAMPAQNWVTLLVPDYYGLPGRNDFWDIRQYGAPNVMEYAGHVGAAAFLLVLVGLIWGRGITRRVWLLLGVAALALLLASGTPLNRFFYFLVPGFAQSGSPARVLVLFCLMQSLLAGLGTEWLLRRVSLDWRGVLLPVGISLGVLLGLGVGLHVLALSHTPLTGGVGAPDPVQPLVRSLTYGGLLAGLLLLLAWLLRENAPRQRVGTLGAAALVLVAGGLVYLGGSYNLTASPEMAYPDTPLTQALQKAPGRVATINRRWSLYELPLALMPPNAAIAYGWRDVQAYDSLLLGHSRSLMDAVARPEESASPPENGNILFVKQVKSPLFPLMSARYVVSLQPLERAGLLPASDFPPGPPYVYEDRLALPEAFTVTNWFAAEDVPGLERLRTVGASGLSSTALVAPGSALPAPNPDTAGMARGVPAELVRHSAQHLTARTTATEPSLLVLAESFAPGWTAVLHQDGKASRFLPVQRVNAAFQGVFVPAGPATVEWTYQPQPFRVGLFIGLLALAVLVGLGLGVRGRDQSPGRLRY
jgi:hypothetical protein